MIELTRSLIMEDKQMAFQAIPDIILMNGKGPYGHPLSKSYESFSVTKGTLKERRCGYM